MASLNSTINVHTDPGLATFTVEVSRPLGVVVRVCHVWLKTVTDSSIELADDARPVDVIRAMRDACEQILEQVEGGAK